MSLRLRLFLVFFITVLAVVWQVIPQRRLLNEQTATLRQFAGVELPAQQCWQEMQVLLWDTRGLVANYLLSGRSAWLERYARQKQKLNLLVKTVASSPGYGREQLLEELRNDLAAYYRQMDDVLDSQRNGKPEIAKGILFGRGFAALSPVNIGLRRISALTGERIKVLETRQQTLVRQISRSIVWSAAILGLCLLTLIVIVGGVIRRLGRLDGAMSLVGRGALSHRLPGKGGDEISGIELGFNRMAVSLTRARERLRRLGQVDGLTGAFNRRYLRREIVKREGREQLGFILFDIDFFKSYNDQNGHPQGDEALKQVSRLARECCGKKDILVRYGGEEFLVMLRGANEKKARRLAEQIRGRIARARFEGEQRLPGGRLTVSLGVSCGIANARTLIKNADEALYCSKRAGRNRVS